VNFDLPIVLAINSFAQRTSWLHGPMLAYSTYGLVWCSAVSLIGYALLHRRLTSLVHVLGSTKLRPLLTAGSAVTGGTAGATRS
jgi:hypothetical protein